MRQSGKNIWSSSFVVAKLLSDSDKFAAVSNRASRDLLSPDANASLSDVEDPLTPPNNAVSVKKLKILDLVAETWS